MGDGFLGGAAWGLRLGACATPIAHGVGSYNAVGPMNGVGANLLGYLRTLSAATPMPNWYKMLVQSLAPWMNWV